MRLLIFGTLEVQIGAASQIAIQRGARVEQVDTTDAGLAALRIGQGADLVMIDEPTEGLAPQIVERVSHLIEEIAARGVAILLVEQKLTIALNISARIYVMRHGRIVFEGTPEDLRVNDQIRKEWLEV